MGAVCGRLLLEGGQKKTAACATKPADQGTSYRTANPAKGKKDRGVRPSSLAGGGSLDDFENGSFPQLGGGTGQNDSQGLGRLSLLTDDFAEIGLGDHKLENRGLLSIDFADPHLFGEIHQGPRHALQQFLKCGFRCHHSLPKQRFGIAPLPSLETRRLNMVQY
jgi:hypothetical protein